jgi:Domain of unknown function (DUF4365)
MAERKIRPSSHVIADLSYHYLSNIIIGCGFTVRSYPADYGYDMSVDTFDSKGQVENGYFFVQLKARGKPNVDAKTGEIKQRVSKKDVAFWAAEAFPVYLVTAGDYNYSSSLPVSAGPSVERRPAIRPAIL